VYLGCAFYVFNDTCSNCFPFSRLETHPQLAMLFHQISNPFHFIETDAFSLV
jgi:hypothetical protein